MAPGHRGPEADFIRHFGQGAQYTRDAFRGELDRNGI